MQRWQLGPDVTVQTSSPLLADALNIVFGATRSSQPLSLRRPVLDYRDRCILLADIPVVHVANDEQLPPVLETLLTRYAAYATGSACGFHAGVVALNGKIILLPGERAAGKSTATLKLADHGTYLGDDIVFVDEVSLRVKGFPKAVTLKAGSFGLFPEAPTYADPVRGPIRYFLPARHATEAGPVTHVVFPQYEKDAPANVKKLDTPIAAFALVQQSFGENTRRLNLSARLAQQPCYHITYSKLSEFENAVRELK